ncbi:MAG: sodium:proton antiporter [Fidelibacterota bacterium]|nr:MAG: sodium:proton antiporter [Candidatus Neomarinimicrobiota bacterium]
MRHVDRSKLRIWAGVILLTLFVPVLALAASEAEAGGDHLGRVLPFWSIIPFIGILLSIAIFPLVAPHFWHHHFGKVSAAWAIIFAVPFLIAYRGEAFYEIVHIIVVDYIPFIIVLWGLFTVGGGIVLRGTLVGTPIVNTVLLLVGTLMASWIGTTGAAMLLIRPVIRANAWRKNKKHIIIFFIFLVANIGGSLTPLGDPPLLLGFIHGVPFFWTLRLIVPMSFVVLILLALFYLLDGYFLKKESGQPEQVGETEPIRLEGIHNFLFLGGIMGLVLMSGTLELPEVSILGVHVPLQDIYRNLGIILMLVLSLRTTRQELREANGFTWAPIKEVAYLFAGIFMTIIPALAILRAGSEGAMAFVIDNVEEPPHYFWVTGILSSFLDNAPTYLTFFNTALGKLHLTEPEVTAFLAGAVTEGEMLVRLQSFETLLFAISIGAVFMGANTYIGNAPNFMVRSIAEENKINMPSFFGYMFWSVLILVPVFILVNFVFLR